MYSRMPQIALVATVYLVSVPIAYAGGPSEEARQISAEELRAMTAGSGERVSVEATVSYQDPIWKFIFLTDQGHGVFVDPVPGTYQLGDRLRITGPVGDGHGVPIFHDDIRVEKLGSGDVPEPAKVDLSGWDWDNGFSDPRNSGWVELEGRVEQVVLIDDSTRLWCREGGRSFAVTLAQSSNLEQAWDLVGARIRVRGSLGILLDRRNRIHAPLLLTQSRSLVTIVESSAVAFPEHPNQRVSYARTDEHGSFRVSGQVTLSTDASLFLDDGFAAARVWVASSFDTPEDAFVEVLGAMNADGQWQARVIARRNETLEIWPTQLSVGSLTEDRIGRRIRIRAIVSNYDAGNSRLRVREEGAQAIVVLPRPAGKDVRSLRLRKSRAGSLDLETALSVDVFGVIERFEDGAAVIRVVSLDDIAVIRRRWPLTATSLLRLLGSLVALLVVVGLIVLFLRAEVAARTRALSDLAAQLRASYDSVDAGVVAVSKAGELLTVNGTANRLLAASLSPGDAADTFIKSLSERSDDASLVYDMASAFRSEIDKPLVSEIALADGRGKIRLTLTAINRDGRYIGNLWVMHDETQLQKLQTELFQAQKMEAIGALAGGIAHDFNNLLTAISGNLELVDFATSEEERRRCVDQGKDACRSATELVQQLLGVSRKTEMKRRVMDANAVIEELRPLLRHGFDPDIVFAFTTAPELPPVYVDPSQLKQVLLNLCVNARDAMPEGGTISIGTEGAELRGAAAVAIKVSDTGEGIAAHIRDKIFEPFFTTKEVGKGTGLGLATSFSVVARHAGELLCESTPGHGATFTILLPVANQRDVAHDQQEPDLDTLRGRETVLIIDDEQLVRTVSSSLLKSGGYQTLEASDGVTGLEMLAQHREVDVVLLDVSMPGMSGHQVLEEIQKTHPGLPVVICSGYDMTTKSGASYKNFLAKPFSAARLFGAIRNVSDPPAAPAVANSAMRLSGVSDRI